MAELYLKSNGGKYDGFISDSKYKFTESKDNMADFLNYPLSTKRTNDDEILIDLPRQIY